MNTNNGKPVLSVRLQLAAEMLKALIGEPTRAGSTNYTALLLCKSDNTIKDNLKDVTVAHQMAYAAYTLADALIEYEQQEKPE